MSQFSFTETAVKHPVIMHPAVKLVYGVLHQFYTRFTGVLQAKAVVFYVLHPLYRV